MLTLVLLSSLRSRTERLRLFSRTRSTGRHGCIVTFSDWGQRGLVSSFDWHKALRKGERTGIEHTTRRRGAASFEQEPAVRGGRKARGARRSKRKPTSSPKAGRRGSSRRRQG